MLLSPVNFFHGAAMALLVGWCAVAQAFDPVADMALLYTAQVDRRLTVPADEARLYGRLAKEVFGESRGYPCRLRVSASGRP